LAGNDISITMRDMERLIDWMRRTGRPQAVESLVRRYIEMLREDRGIKSK
jgi:TPP-dependent pyruvate/acetoin dehydrogenase alpha subunit